MNRRRAMVAMPASADDTAIFALILTYTGKYDQSADLMERAIRLNPARHDWHRWNLARARRLAGRPQEARARLRQAVDVPVVFMLGRYDKQLDARLAAAYFRRLKAPGKSLIWFEHSAHNIPFEEPERFNKTLRKSLDELGIR